MEDGGFSTPQQRKTQTSPSQDSETPYFVEGEDQMLRKAKRPPPNEIRQKRATTNLKRRRQNKKNRCRGNDCEEMMTSSSGKEGEKDNSIEKKKKEKCPRLDYIETPSPDDNDSGSGESRWEPSSKKKLIYT
ncbi:uncharacterized protein LOC132624915 [Lycium barbarum]|uniref:uncharacterized protein LOC132624915 n=1 Tax=Lycium barbarum TaxID=112863 RepID=UPI00293F2580|nr:uncharacterized protein LOC132624915 [Lycium barbarum]